MLEQVTPERRQPLAVGAPLLVVHVAGDDPGALPELEGQGIYELLDHVFATGEPYVGSEVPLMIERRPDARILLLGRGGVEFAARLRARDPRFAGVFWTPGYLGPDALSYHLQAADIAIQPYPDGADTRRTSLMACLANGVPTVTTRGRFTTGDVMLSVVGYPVAGEPHTAGQIAAEIQADPRTAVVGEFPDLPLREATRAAYLANFAIDHPVARLLADEDGG